MAEILIWLLPAVAAALGVVLGRALGRSGGKLAGKREAERDAMEATLEKVERGRSSVRDGRNAGAPADRLRDNDGHW